MTTPDPTDLPLGFRDRVLALVARIPPGRVMTYGQLALLAGQPGAARQAGFVLNSLMGGTDLPWQRVINAQGRVSTHKLGFGDVQQKLLEAEGVVFDASGRCDLKVRQWWPDEDRNAPPEPMLGMLPPRRNGPQDA
ncbi:MGMT family protein [Deinococcus enclensis]|uniref:Methylated-DNA-protein-cysteine methyltransferase-like protein n=1 Tax=Deinococcus enclensis TaxID=1049582 RepID=A0ABT9MGS2_9DEIO|nr:MGMT family protein [Deinococcus enclensis]MDP9765656.1 methylated-DNA-protein-cysteine methyltransferase-like protein [Deinococcus enclensis]